METKILVLGVGNILYTDEGIGVRAVEYLQAHYTFPPCVTLMDGGTLGMGLMHSLMECDVVFVLDAVLGDGEPGSLYRLVGEDLRKSLSFRDSMHQLDLVDTLIFCELAGKRPDAIVLGMEPVDYHSMGTELTGVAQEQLPAMAQALFTELGAYGIAPKAKQ